MSLSENKGPRSQGKKKGKGKQARPRVRKEEKDPGLAITYAKCPILEARVGCDDFSNGLRNVLFSREASDDQIAVAGFLVDVYCLGVKDAFFRLCYPSEYEEIVDKMRNGLGEEGSSEKTPEYVRKLIDGAVEYAGDLGFPPHRDFEKAYPLFGDVNARKCREKITFGKDGKPFYCASAFDTLGTQTAVIRQLREQLGEEGFYCMAKMPGVLPFEDDFFCDDDLDMSWEEEDDFYFDEDEDMIA